MIAGLSPTALLLNAILAALAGFLLGNLWYRHRRALDRDRVRWSSLAERRGWHLVERGGGFAVIGNADQEPPPPVEHRSLRRPGPSLAPPPRAQPPQQQQPQQALAEDDERPG